MGVSCAHADGFGGYACEFVDSGRYPAAQLVRKETGVNRDNGGGRSVFAEDNCLDVKAVEDAGAYTDFIIAGISLPIGGVISFS